jgi:hypothetical protein
MRMRTRSSILVAAVTAALLAGGVSPAVALSEPSAAATAVAGRMLVAPRAEALVTRLPVRVAVRVPARTSRLRVRVGGRDVTARFRPRGGSLRVAKLTRGAGLRYGPNHLLVLAQRRGRRPVAEARSFVLARRQDGLVRLRLRRGPVTSLGVQVTGAPGLAPEHFRQPGEVERRLSVIRRVRKVRVWLNGRRVTGALDRAQPTRWTASLSASHGLRYGANRLRILVAEPDRGRYALLRRRFVVRRNGHLAAAGWDTATRVGGRVRLDGRRSRAARGGHVRHSWRILSRPSGSRAKLRRAGSARPLLTPDRPGHYVVGLTVRARTRLGTASQAAPSSTDSMTLTAAPASPLVDFKALTAKNGQHGIQVGDQFYANPSPGASSMQWLMLDRATLLPCDDPSQPCGPNITTGNSWLDGSWDGPKGLNTLAAALCSPDPAHPNCRASLDQLVILSYPPGGPAPPVQIGPIDAFNNTLKAIGVGPIDSGVLQSRNKLAIVGVPTGGDGSGWYTHGGGPLDPLTGWLMPDATATQSRARRFRFQPERATFDTSSSHTSASNTMSIRGDQVTASLPPGVTGGFHVVELDPFDFRVVSSDAYGSNGSWDGLGPMVDKLRQIIAAGNSVAVQSIGHPTPSSPTWPQVAFWLSEFGANPDTFTTIDGPYAFLGNPQLGLTEVAESSHTIEPDPTSATRESGTLRGRARIRSDGYFMPVATDTADALAFPLYEIVFQDPTPWPYTCSTCDPTTPGAPVDVAAYARALADITAYLPDLRDWAPDLRKAYAGNDTLTYSDSKTDLLAMPYPGDGYTCTDDAGRMKKDPGYTRKQFCKLSAELQIEFDWLDATQTLFNSYDKVLNRTGNQQQVDLETIGTFIHDAVAPPPGADISSPILQLIQSIFRLGGPVGGTISGAIGVVASAYELGTAVTSNAKGAPVGDQVDTTVDELASKVATDLSGTANTLDSLRDIVISDYGRLTALGSVASSPAWSFDVGTMTNNLTTAANAYFSSVLVPVAYDVWYLAPGNRNPDPTVDNCWYDGGTHFSGAPATAQLQFHGHFNEADDNEPVHLLVLAHQQGAFSGTPWYPPSTVTDPMFTPIAQSGYGVYAPGFFWSQYPNAITPQVAACTTE